VGRRIRELREARGWSQEQLAEAADLHENYISRLETGRQEPGFFVLLRLCRAFEITPAQLLDESPSLRSDACAGRTDGFGKLMMRRAFLKIARLDVPVTLVFEEFPRSPVRRLRL